MLVSNVEYGVLGILAILVVGSLILLHYLLFREYARQEKIQIQRLKDFEKLVNLEINRSQSLSNSFGQLREIKEKTDEKLEVINLQVQGMKGRESKPPYN
ncbi:hypothetical protein [Algoriphagus sp.]|uniref:hypothetical protein n=1 Tax=Algoriphagus sp. TaxID=1872435 RepID=UPI00391A7761